MEKLQFKELSYLLIEPNHLRQKNPAILFLHGAGTRGDDIRLLQENCFFSQESFISREDSPFLVFAPQCHRDTWFDLFEQLRDFAEMVWHHPLVDQERVCLIGTSMGGYAAWQLGMSLPELFAAIVPICGGGMKWNAKRLVHVPVWAFHGKKDQTVPSEESILMVNAVNSAGGNAKLTLLENVAHNSWVYAYSSEELFLWLLQQHNSNVQAEQEQKYSDSVSYG